MEKTAILFKTHFINRFIRSRYQKLLDSCPDSDVWFLLNGDEVPNAKYDWIKRLFVYNSQKVRECGYPFKDFWFCAHYPALLFYLENPGYDYYWMIEYDVDYTGQWQKLISSFGNEDLLAVYVKPYVQEPDWYWWSSATELHANVPRDFWLMAFLPIARFSNKALKTLDEYHLKGYYGYCESTVPTLLNWAGLTVRDLNKSIQSKDELYSKKTLFWGKGYVRITIKKKDMLYHPDYGGAQMITLGIRNTLIPIGIRNFISRCLSKGKSALRRMPGVSKIRATKIALKKLFG